MYDKSMNCKFAAIKNGKGEIKGYIEVFYANGKWVTIPGASRSLDAKGKPMPNPA
jgi:hypothetical protein